MKPLRTALALLTFALTLAFAGISFANDKNRWRASSEHWTTVVDFSRLTSDRANGPETPQVLVKFCFVTKHNNQSEDYLQLRLLGSRDANSNKSFKYVTTKRGCQILTMRPRMKMQVRIIKETRQPFAAHGTTEILSR